MEKVSKRRQAVLDVLDEQIEELTEKLKPAEKMIEERNRLIQTRKVLLNERGTTSGGGIAGQLSMEEVVRVLRDADEMLAPQEIAEATGYDAHRVRSHLSRAKGTRYYNEDGKWGLIEDREEE